MAPKNDAFRIYVVCSIDDTVLETYLTGFRDFIFVPLNEARRSLSRLGNGYYAATDNPEIAKEFNLRLLESKMSY
ncbi:hypothetical protein HY637_00425 [Candidatus Woesearchaeota archaeon]|nr:hypothetical protein [Candidatus Woesearchaeota archaeon]